MPTAPICLSAKNELITIGGVTLYPMDWDCDPETPWLDSSTGANGGFGTQVADFFDCNASINGFLDFASGNFPFELAIPLVAGYEIAEMKLWFDYVNFPDMFWYFPFFSIKSVKTPTRVKDKVNFGFTGKNQGPFQYPSLGEPNADEQTDLL